MGIIINGQNDTIGPVDNSMSLLGTVSIGGTMTIEDFTNIDSVGLVTARQGIDTDTVRGNTNNSNLAIGARASNGAFVQTITIKPDRSVGLGNITNPTSILDVRQTNTGAATEIKLFNLDQSNATTQTAALVMTPDVRANGVKIVAVKEVADMSSSANKDLALTFQSVANNTAVERLRVDSSGRVSLNNNSRPASDASEGAQLRVTGTPLTRNQYYSPAGDYFGSFGYTDNTYTKSWIAVDSSYNKTSSVSSGIFLSAFHSDANGSACGHTIKNVRTDAGGLIFSSVHAASSTGNPAVETERLRITTAGKVGINESNPDQALHVKSADGDTVPARIESTGAQSRLGFQASGSVSSYHVSCGAEANNFIVHTNNTERLRITSSGQMGLGTNDPNSYGGSVKLAVANTSGTCGLSIVSATNGDGNLYYADGTSGDATYRGYIRYNHTLDQFRIGVAGAERLRITSDGKIGLDGNTNPVAKLHIGAEDDATLTAQTLFVEGAKTGYANYAGLPQNQLCVYDNTASTAGSGGAIGFAANCGGSQQTWIGAIESQRDSSTNNASNYAGSLVFWTRPAQSTPTEKLRIDSAGTIKCGTSATLKAEINSAIGGHQFISQCSDNNNGFEIYQQHGSTTTRNTFAVYANTGGGGAQELQFSVRGDGCVTKPTSPAFSASLSSGNINAANYNNVIIFNNQQFDNSNSYNTGNGRFTAPVAGKYYFGVQIYAGFDFSGVRVLHSKFVKNGSDFATADMFGGSSNHGGTYYHPTGCGHILMDLAVNDWVAFNSGGFSASGTGNALIYAQGGTRFFGYLVG